MLHTSYIGFSSSQTLKATTRREDQSLRFFNHILKEEIWLLFLDKSK